MSGINADAENPAPSDGYDELAVPVSLANRRVTWSETHTTHVLPHAPSSAASVVEAHCGSDASTIPGVGCWQGLKARAAALKRDVLALYYAVHHPSTPWYCRLLPALVLAYALSPIDLIPDFIPVLGLLDDLLLLPLGLWLSYRLIPPQVMEECRERAAAEPRLLGRSWVVALLVFALWTACLLLTLHWGLQWYGDAELLEGEHLLLASVGGLAAVGFSAWLVCRVRHEARRRDEWLLAASADEAVDGEQGG